MPRKSIDTLIVAALVAGRWLMAPLYLGLIAVLMIVVVEFFRELVDAVAGFGGMGSASVILVALRLIDLALIGNLVLIMSVSGVDTFAAKTAAADPRDAIGSLDFAGLKLKILASIVAIAAVDLLESFIKIESANKSDLLWEVVILLAFALAGLLLAWMDRLSAGPHRNEEGTKR